MDSGTHTLGTLLWRCEMSHDHITMATHMHCLTLAQYIVQNST